MLKKISLLAMLGVCWSFSASAIPNANEYGQCIKNNATDAGLTQCYKKETEAVKKEIQKLEDMLRPITTIANDSNLTILNKYMSEYIKTYCEYYIRAHKGDGYSQQYHSAKCQLLGYEGYYYNLESLYNISISDIKE